MHNIRKAEIKDCSIILGFIKELAIYEKLEDQFVATEEQIKIGLFGKIPRAEALIIEENEVSVGYALYFYNYSTFLCKPGIYIEDLYIQPRYCAKGYGKSLLKYICKIAEEKDCGRVEWACLGWNKSSIDFYLKLKAEALSDWTIYRLNKKEISNVANS